MANFTAKDVNDLRKSTGVGLMDCKKALTEADGDVESTSKRLGRIRVMLRKANAGNDGASHISGRRTPGLEREYRKSVVCLGDDA